LKPTLYRTWGVETGWAGFLVAGLRVGTVLGAAKHGFLPGRVDGPLNRIPADFLIAPSGRLEVCYYGRDAGDHLPMERIDRFLQEWPTPDSASSTRPAA
jgi:hypothetical protein